MKSFNKLGLRFLASMVGACPFVMHADDDMEENVFTLDPFLVAVDETSYVPHSSVVASGFAIENVKNPISIASLSERFVDDLKFDDLAEAAPYISGTSKRAGPASQGTLFRVRGFGTTWSTRNGVQRYIINGTDNLDRLEVVKGPAAVFFGQASPGGVVNYVTKRPSFNPVMSTEVRYGSYDYKRIEAEIQGPLFDSDMFAYRINSSYLDKEDWRDFEFQKRSFIYTGVLFQPIENLKFYAEYELIKDKFNEAGAMPHANPHWMRGFLALTEPDNPVANYYSANPGEIGLNNSASSEDVIARLQGRWRANRLGTNDRWREDTAKALGVDPSTLPTEEEFVPEATPFGWRWNPGGPAQFAKSDLENITLESVWTLTEWFTLRGQAVWDNLHRTEFSGGSTFFEMRANGPSFTGQKLGLGALSNESRTLGLSGVFRFDVGILNSTLLIGVDEFRDNFVRVRWEDDSSPKAIPSWSYQANGYPEQDFGNSFFYFDGLNHISTRRSTLINYIGRLWDDRLVVMAGIRDENFSRVNPNTDPESVTLDVDEKTPSFGAVIELFEGVNLFGSLSESFDAGGGATVAVLNTNLSSDEKIRLEEALGSDVFRRNKRGKGWDIGLKSDWNNGMVSGTVSYYQVEETNLFSEYDPDATVNEPLNQDYLAENPNARPQDLPVQRFSPFGVARGEGIEMDVIYQPNRDLSVVFSYTHFFKAEVRRADGTAFHAREAPKNRASVWGKYSFREGRLEGLSIGAGMVASSSLLGRERVNNQNFVQESYVAFDGLIQYEMEFGDGQKLLLSLNLRNLTDERFWTGFGTPERNRQFLFSAKYTF